LLFGKKLFILSVDLKMAFAFCLFCLASSAVYIANDIIDIKKDRFHITKRLRPIASGKVSIRNAGIVALILGALSVAGSFMIDVYFGWLVLVYLTLNFAYSRVLKHLVIIDVFCLGAFFLLRIIAGGIVSKINISQWIIIMTVLLALFLGFNKRRQEIRALGFNATKHKQVLAKYSPYFIDQMIAVTTSSIVIAYMLYIMDARIAVEFDSRKLMYSVPFVYYGIFRYLYIVHKVGKEGDPTRILFFDKALQIDILGWLGICFWAVYF